MPYTRAQLVHVQLVYEQVIKLQNNIKEAEEIFSPIEDHAQTLGEQLTQIQLDYGANILGYVKDLDKHLYGWKVAANQKILGILDQFEFLGFEEKEKEKKRKADEEMEKQAESCKKGKANEELQKDLSHQGLPEANTLSNPPTTSSDTVSKETSKQLTPSDHLIFLKLLLRQIDTKPQKPSQGDLAAEEMVSLLKTIRHAKLDGYLGDDRFDDRLDELTDAEMLSLIKHFSKA